MLIPKALNCKKFGTFPITIRLISKILDKISYIIMFYMLYNLQFQYIKLHFAENGCILYQKRTKRTAFD